MIWVKGTARKSARKVRQGSTTSKDSSRVRSRGSDSFPKRKIRLLCVRQAKAER